MTYLNNTIYLGKYQNEDLEWIVLEEQNSKALLLTKNIIDSKRFSENDSYYDTSTIRMWLNNEFYNISFNDIEKNLILDVINDNIVKNVYNCPVTIDKIFLLSLNQIERYFPNNSDRIAFGTSYAKSNGLLSNKDKNSSMWWLRSNILNDDMDVYVIDFDGLVYDQNRWYQDIGVRCACWIDLNKYKKLRR